MDPAEPLEIAVLPSPFAGRLPYASYYANWEVKGGLIVVAVAVL